MTFSHANSRSILLVAAALFVASLVLFSPCLKHEFLNFDDDLYVTRNPLLSPFGLDTFVHIFSRAYYQSYIPLTLVSHAIDLALWGSHAG